MRKAVLNGNLIDEKEAVLPVTSKAFQYSYSVYEVIKIKEGKIIFFDDHFKRLELSASSVNIRLWFSKEDLRAWIEKLIVAESILNERVRILVVGDLDYAFITHESLLPVDSTLYKDGIKCTFYYGERFMPQSKTSNLLMSYLALEEAHASGAYEALFVNHDNLITEGTRSNFYALEGDILYTADETLVLNGITRIHIIKAAKKLGLDVHFDAVKPGDIKYFDGVFISSTSLVALPVNRINNEEMKKTAWPKIEEIRKMVSSWE